MRKIHVLIHSLLLSTSPSLIAYPQSNQPIIQQVFSQDIPYDGFNLTYDEILALLQNIEEGRIDEYSAEDSERIRSFIVCLAKQGILPNNYLANGDLKNDIAELFIGEEDFFDSALYCNNASDEYSIFLPVLLGGENDAMIISCKKRHKKKCHQSHHDAHKQKKSLFAKLKRFIKKHRKAIIIGTVVIIAATVVIVAAIASSAAGAAAAGTAVAGAVGTATAESDRNEQEQFKEKEGQRDVFSISAGNSLIDMPTFSETPELESAIEECMSNFKAIAVEEKLLQVSSQSQGHENAALEEIARNLGANLAHQTLDGLSELISFVPRLLEEIKDLGHQILPESIFHTQKINEITPLKNFDNLVVAGHEKIDEVFSTDQANWYTPESKEARNKYAIGIIPFPGVFFGGIFNTNKLAEAGKIADRAGFTRAGRSLMKHGYREGSIFPKPAGNPDQINEHGQKILEVILNHPEKKLIPGELERFGKVVDIYAPGIGGARYTAEGEFIGFLEP